MIGSLLAIFDAIAFRLFGRHCRSDSHETARNRYRALPSDIPFETYLIRLYALTWVIALPVAIGAALGIASLLKRYGTSGPGTLGVLGRTWPRIFLALLGGILVGIVVKYLLRRVATAGLGYLTARRRNRVEQTLPGVVRYLHVAATGSTDPQKLFERIALRPEIHGATAERFAAICKHQSLTGSMETAIRCGARDTPARDTLAPFLLSFLERYREGDTALEEFLAEESRLQAVEDERRHQRDSATLRTVVGLFVLLLAGPLIAGVVLAGATIALPGFELGPSLPALPTIDGIVTGIAGLAILLLGGGASLLAVLLRPRGHRWAAPMPSQSPRKVLASSLSDPKSAAVVFGPLGLCALAWGLLSGIDLETTLVAGYAILAIPVGLVDLRRARRRSRLDRSLPAFVHDLSEQLDSGRPLREAVTDVAQRETYGPLDEPVRKLAADLQLIHGPEGGRKRALERFVGRIGTPFAGRTVGLAIGAIEAGADAKSAITHLQTETGRLDHADRARRTRFSVLLLVGWTVAMLIFAIVIAVNLMVLDVAAPSGPVAGVTVETAGGPTRERPLFYVLTQATMLASGWFAGLTGRGVYEALLHSGILLGLTWAGFAAVGLL